MQTDLDDYMAHYNNERTNQGKRCQGRTPKQTWDDGYELYKKYVIESTSMNGIAIQEDRPSPQVEGQRTNTVEDGVIKNIQKVESEVTTDIAFH